MIVPMKKYSFLVYHKEYLDFLEGLREVGVLHVIEKASGEIEDENLRLNYQQINELKNAIRFLAKREVETQVKGKSKDGLEVLEDLKKLQADQEDYQHKLTQLKKERSLLEPWGEFSWRTLEKLDNAGYRIRFYICPSRDYNPEWETLFSLFLINDIAGQKYFIVAGKKDETVEIDAESVHLPKTSLSVLNKDIADIESILVKTEGYYDKMAALSLTDMRRTQERLLSELKFNKVLLSTHKEAEDKVMFLEGWVPVDTETKLLDFLNRENIYYESSEASEEDKVPIKLKNSRFARLFEPIGRLYMLPTHKELDLTPFFAPFFMLFFGFCLGDAGYGLFILAVSLLMRKRVKPNLRPFLDLGIYLSLATILFGFISGTFFGINLIDTGYMLTAGSIAEMQNSGIPSNIIETVRPLIGIEYTEQAAYLKAITEVLPDPSVLADYKSVFLKVAPSNYNFLNLFRYRMLDTNNMMYLSLVLGYIQIVFGMFIKTMNIIIFKGLKYAFSMFGWLLIVLGGGIAYMLKFFGIIQPDLGNKLLYSILIAGFIPVLFYNTPGKNIFLNLGLGIWDTYGMASGLVGDLLSYIRLFALGLSSAVLGMVFNKLAVSLLGLPPVLGHLLFLVLLLLGHTLNLFMAALGSFVHPMRLTFVEFYKNAGFTGGGKEYQPFVK